MRLDVSADFEQGSAASATAVLTELPSVAGAVTRRRDGPAHFLFAVHTHQKQSNRLHCQRKAPASDANSKGALRQVVA